MENFTVRKMTNQEILDMIESDPKPVLNAFISKSLIVQWVRLNFNFKGAITIYSHHCECNRLDPYGVSHCFVHDGTFYKYNYEFEKELVDYSPHVEYILHWSKS